MITEALGAVHSVVTPRFLSAFEGFQTEYSRRLQASKNHKACWHLLPKVPEILKKQGFTRDAIEGKGGGWQYSWIEDSQHRLWRFGYDGDGQSGGVEPVGYTLTIIEEGKGDKPVEVLFGPNKGYAPSVNDPAAIAELIRPGGGSLLYPSELFERLPEFSEMQNLRAAPLLQEFVNIVESQRR